jgi:CBS domain-containing protein
MTRLTAHEMMTPNVLTARDDMSVAELVSFLSENAITGTAVRDDEGRLVGVVSLTDIAASTGTRADIVADADQPDLQLRGWEDIYNREEIVGLHVEHVDLTVSEIMSPTVQSVSEDANISEVAQEMLVGRVHRLFVTRGDELVCVISTSDFLSLFIDKSDPS